MSTFTFRVTSSATNVAGTAFGQQPDLGAPSFFDMIVTGSVDPNLPNGTYDAYCLNPFTGIYLSPTLNIGQEYAGNTLASYAQIGFNSLTQAQVDQLNWLLAQNFTSDPKYGGQFNYGEVQTAIWKIVGFTDQQIASAGFDQYLNDNYRNIVTPADITLLVSEAQSAIANGLGVVPTNAYFSEVIDGTDPSHSNARVQPLVVQLQSAKLGNFVWLDGNHNGIQDTGEAGVNNVVVELYDGVGNLLASTVTGDDFSTVAVEQGYYQFTGLKAGNYQVKFVAPTYQFTVRDANSNTQDAADSDANGATGFSQVLALAAGESNQTIDAGLILPASLGDRLWVDTNADGKQDINHTTEPGIVGRTVTLIGGGANGVIGTGGDDTATTTLTGVDGVYAFTGLTPGVQYQVQFGDIPAGTVFTTPNVSANAFDAIDSDANTTTGKTQIVTLAQGENNITLDAGVYTPASLSGYVYKDAGNDGVRNSEPPIAGVVLTLTGTDGAGNAVTGTATTDANGFYQFLNLAPGSYTVSEAQPAGYIDGKDTVGSTGGSNAVNDVLSGITLVSGANSVENNFGEIVTASLGDRLWVDTNADGKQDINHTTEPGIVGRTVTLIGGGANGVIGTGGDDTATTTLTGVDGVYAFTGLTPGVQYQVQFGDIPAGTVFTTPNVSANAFDAIDSDANTTTGKTQIVTLAQGENNITLDAGVYTPASLSGYVYKDAGNDGVRNSEPPIAGVVLTLTGTDGAGNAVTGTATTDANGFYQFLNLAPGSYTVSEAQPAGYIDGKDTVGSTGGSNAVNDVLSGITLVSGANSVENNFGEIVTASLGDRLWVDTNADGKQDINHTTEPGIVGRTVTLIGGGANGVIGTGGDDTATTTLTGVDGVYAFTGLTPGVQYQVQFGDIPAGTVFTTPNVSANAFDAIDSDANTTTGKTQIVTLAQGENNITLDAGVYNPASLSGYVYKDAGNDGVRNSEPPIAGVVLTLTGTDGAGNAVTGTATTDANGFYQFLNLAPGSYTVSEAQPAGYIDGKDTVGSTGGSNAVNDVLSGITLVSGANSVENNFGEIVTASLGDRLWVDTNADGKQDINHTTEPGIVGRTVTLIGGGANGVIGTGGDDTATTTLTGVDGVYAFTGLTPGVQYQVQFGDIPAGTVFTTPNVSANAFDAIDSDANTTTGKTQIVTLAQGENNITLDAGVYTPASLSGYVYKDAGNDGVRNSEPPIAGVVLTLTGTDGAGNAVTGTATTDANGFYQFLNLAPGSYTVSEAQPAGYIDGKDTVGSTGGSNAVNDVLSGITLVSGANSVENNFGEIVTASLGDRLWVDTNADGKQDINHTTEPGIVGRTVTLIGGGANGVIGTGGDDTATTTLTGVDGVYAFTGLTPGVQYQVQFGDIPAGTVFTTPNVSANAFDAIDSDANTTTGKTQIVTLAQGENNITLDAGVYNPASLSGYVYKDAGNDGVRNSEPPIAGVVLTLTGTDGAGNAVTGTATTDANGFYQFLNLAPGSYTVSEAQPAGYIDGKDTVGSTGGSNAVNDVLSGITLVSGANSVENNFGEIVTASLGDRLWVDTNADGKQDINHTTEPGIVGRTVTLIGGGANGVIGTGGDDTATTTLTGVDGVYAFTGLTPGVQYQVQFGDIPAGTVFTTPNVSANAFDAIDSDANTTTGKTQIVTLAQGENNITLDAGVYTPASLSGYVYKDAGNDGVRNSEPPIAGVVLTLTGTDGAGNAVTGTATTDANGFYQFLNLAPGSYTVSEAQPAGYIDGKDTVGSTGGSNAVNDVLSGITLVSGANSVENNFGEIVTASLGDRLWVDTNADGKQDINHTTEPGIVGRTVTLIGGGANGVIGTGGDDTATTTLTGVDGVYAFTGLTPGVQYQVQFGDIPAGTVFTTPNVSANAFDAIDSDANTTTGKTQIVTLAQGENNITLDAGVYNPASLGDYVWIDTNANGLQDAGEVGVSGVTVKLIGGGADGLINGIGDTTSTTTTGANGFYQFTGLTPGVQYQVDFDAPAGGYVFTTANAGDDTKDSDASIVDGKTQIVTLTSGENNPTLDAGIYRAAIDIEKLVHGEYMTGGSGGTEGLTPGFWKTHSSFGPAPLAGWPESGYSPTQSWEAVFGVDVLGAATPTLLDALGTGGGGVNALLRHATAALLNAANPNVDYLYTVSSIISATKAAILSGNATTIENLKNQYATQNQLGADLSTPASTGTLVVTPDVDADTSGSGPQIPIGGKAVFTYIVTNKGDVEISNVLVSDNRLAGVTFVGGDTDGDGKLDVSETWTYRAQEIVTSTAEISNIGTVTGMGGRIPVTDSDAAYYNGLTSTQSLGDFVWLDANANGKQDGGEAGIAGLTITLIGGGANGVIGTGGDDTTATTTTDVDGYYQFDNLLSGVQYQVQFSKPAGTAYTTANVGSNGFDTVDSDADTATGKSQIVTLAAGQNNLTVDAGVYLLTPGIDIEKTTNGSPNANPTAPDYDNEDAANGAGVPILTPGTTVTWTYKVTNTGNTTFAKADVAIVDDNGTPGNTADDLSVANGKITYLSGDVGSDNLLSPGEVWLYKASGIVQSLTTLGAASTFDFNGSSGTDGTDGNVRTFTAGAISVHASAFSRDKSSGAWEQAWLGSYGGGLGVTDSGEGSGGSNTHTVDNMGGRDNYVLFEFDQNVVVDSAFLGYVVNDSDMKIWIGSRTNAYTSHDALLSDADLTALGFTELNSTTLTTTRLADLNAGNVSGNVLVIAADTTDTSPEDMFKIQKLTVAQAQSGVYENKATVTAPGAAGDSDLSHYKNPAAVVPAQIGNFVWCDTNGNGIQDAGEPGVCGVTVKLLNSVGAVVATTTTDTSGNYKFSSLVPGDYQVQFVAPAAYGGFTKANQGSNDAVDSDADVSTGKTSLTTLVSGENDTSWDAGLTPPKVALTYDFSGSTATSGTAGNTSSYIVDGVTVTASAFSRTTGGQWDKAYLGAYGGGHGVTDTGETGSSNTHTVDNVGRIDYVLYQFSQNVVVDQAYLGYVVGDSDLTAWIGSSVTTLTSLSDSLLAGMTKEDNNTTSTGARWADINAGSKEGNILVIAASTSDTTPDDYFKIKQLSVCTDSTTVTPIAIDLDGHGIATVASADSGGKFDLLGNGQPVASGWLASGEGFLAVDGNHNGKIDSISELFGGGKQGDGFAKLIAFDSNGDLVVDAKDDGFVDLSVWRDANGNHQTDAGELMSLAEAGVASLNVDYQGVPFMDASGNLHLEQSSAGMSDGTVVDMTDIYFAVAANDVAAVDAKATLDPGWLFG